MVPHLEYAADLSVGTAETRIREQITEQIEYRPSQYVRLHLVRFVYVRPGTLLPPVMAPLPAQVIPQAGVRRTSFRIPLR